MAVSQVLVKAPLPGLRPRPGYFGSGGRWVWAGSLRICSISKANLTLHKKDLFMAKSSDIFVHKAASLTEAGKRVFSA